MLAEKKLLGKGLDVVERKVPEETDIEVDEKMLEKCAMQKENALLEKQEVSVENAMPTESDLPEKSHVLEERVLLV